MKRIMLSICALALIAIALPALAERPAVPEGPMVMDLTKKPVTFNHSFHTTVDCGTCHHEVDGAENYGKCSASGCHDLLGNKEKSKVNSYYRVTHERKLDNSCVGCHVKVAKEKKDKAKTKAMTGCSGSACHP